MIRKNVIAAISAAVALTLDAERREGEAARAALSPPPPPPAGSPWAFAGRMSAAQMRQLFQLRVMRSR